jgi:hypothetical protein
MARNNTAVQIALLVGAFALSFFATILIRESTPAANVTASAWTDDAEAAARTREREESLRRGVAALQLESRRISEQVARKSQDLSARVDKARGIAAEAAEPKALLALDQLAAKVLAMAVRERLRTAKEQFDLTAPQVAAYEARLREAAEKNPLQVLENGGARFDEEALAPLLDREQLATYRERAKAQAEMQDRTDAQRIARDLGIPPDQGTSVFAILREEGAGDEDAMRRYMKNPGEGSGLIQQYASAMDRSRARLRPMLSPEAFEKLDRHFEEQAESLKFLIGEMEKESKK